jgi:hypothetical protein
MRKSRHKASCENDANLHQSFIKFATAQLVKENKQGGVGSPTIFRRAKDSKMN